MPSRRLEVEIIGDSRQLERTLGKTETRLKKFGKSLDGTFAGGALAGRGAGGLGGLAKGGGYALAAGFATQKALQFAQAASDLNEQVSKSKQVFGRSARDIEAWSKTTARAMGISQTQALEASGTFGNLLRTVDITPQKAAKMSQALVKLAADLASFNNASPEDALEALRSGLIGEAEPLRRFGVLLSETRVQQEAMAETGKKSAKELTAQEKALARYNLILKDTAPAQGDFARTSSGLANQQRILNAQIADLEANLGKLLIPVLTDVTAVMNGALVAALKFGDALSRLGKINIPGLGGLKGLVGKAIRIVPNPLTGPALTHDLLKKIGGADNTPAAKAPTPVVIHGERNTQLHVSVDLDGTQVGKAVVNTGARRTKTGAPQRRGRKPGQIAGLS